ncbi:hypothetical protein AMECASPLE_023494 [Ameca splendens]|uniref:Uncharacterized protein n=1 Tax=Ameca splendens TaxID=208324 RepID=A0ABV1ABK3_9TELE
MPQAIFSQASLESDDCPEVNVVPWRTIVEENVLEENSVWFARQSYWLIIWMQCATSTLIKQGKSFADWFPSET